MAVKEFIWHVIPKKLSLVKLTLVECVSMHERLIIGTKPYSATEADDDVTSFAYFSRFDKFHFGANDTKKL